MWTCRALLLLLLYQLLFLQTGSSVKIAAPPSHNILLGSDIVLPCSFSVESPQINLQFLAVLWLFQERELVRIDNQGEKFQPRMFVNKQNIVKGIASLEITNVSISDTGKYTCMIIYSPNRDSLDVDLAVYATPSIHFEKVDADTESFAVCSVTGFYPKNIKVDILKDDETIKDFTFSEYENPDGTHSINSSWTIRTDVEPKPKVLSCLVHSGSDSVPLRKEIQIIYNDGETNNAALVGGLVGGVIVVIAVIIGVYIYRKKSGYQKLMVTEIEGPVWRDGEKTTLSCKAIGCRKDVQVTWVIESRGGTRVEVSEAPPRDGEAPPRDEEEAQPLMSREYEVTNEWTRNNHDVTTKLTFIPSISRNLGSTVTCRVIHREKQEERTYKPKSIYATPKLIEPLKFTLFDQGNVQISGSFQRFHPREMEVSWTSKRGQSADKIQSQEEVMGNADGTFNLESNCTVSGELFKDPSYKVMVTWRHESMEKPQCREISVRELPWRPKLQSFPIDSVFQDDEVLLQCRVSDFFPDALTVRWFERKPGSQDLVDVSRSEKYTMQDIISQKTERNTFSTTATLSYKRSQLSEKGVDFICRVEHPSLEEPIQNSISQYKDTEPPRFTINNINGPQIWYNEEKVTLYCSASYCMKNTQVVWLVGGDTVCEKGAEDVRMDNCHPSGYVAHREITEDSDTEGLVDITSSLTFTPSISKHKNVIIKFKISSDEKAKEKTVQPKHFFAKPRVSSPINLYLTDSGEVICSLDIEGFYPSDVLIKWNDSDTTGSTKLSENTDGTYSVHSDYKLPASFFQQEDSTVRVGWKHESMEKWETRRLSVRDKEFPWKLEVKDIVVPNLLIGSMATLRCEVSNVFPDVLTVKWLKKEKDSEELFLIIHSEKYKISELRPEKQKDNTFTYKASLQFQPSISTEEGAEFICRVEHPPLEKPAERSTGPLTVTAAVQKFVVGEIRGPHKWIHGEKVTLYCSVSDCSEDTHVIWMVESTDGMIAEISNTGEEQISKHIEKSDKEGLFSLTTELTLVPSVSKHLGVTITCKITSNGETKVKKFQPKSLHGRLHVLEPVHMKLDDGGDVLCTLSLQNFYPKQVKVTWTSGGEKLTSTEEYTENSDKTYNGQSHCTVPGKLLLDPSFTLRVTCDHDSLETPLSQVLTWRDPGLAWSPEIEAVPISRVLMDRWTTVQYNISRYFPDAVTVSWYRRESGGRECVPLPDNKEKYQIEDLTQQRQQDHTYSCTARLRFKPALKDQESEIICRVAHPSLEALIEKSSGPLHVQAKPKVRKAVDPPLGKGKLKCSLLLENFYPKHIQIEWHCGTGEQLTQTCQSQETCRPNMDKTFSVTSVCRVPENLLHSPDSRVRVTWRHESMDDLEYREVSIGDKAIEQQQPIMEDDKMDHKHSPVASASKSHQPSSQEIEQQQPAMKNKAVDSKNSPVASGSRSHSPPSQAIEQQQPIVEDNKIGNQDSPVASASTCPHPPSQAIEPQQPITEDEDMDTAPPPDVPSPESQQLPPQHVYNMMGHQHPPNVPAQEINQLSPQDVYNRMGQQHPPNVPAPEFHQLPSQDVHNMMGHQHPPDVPAPESYQLSPQDVYNMMGHQHPHNVPEFRQLPPQVYNMMGHQHLPNVPAPESHQLPPQDVHNMMGLQHPPDVPAPESHQLSPQDVYNMMGHQHPPDVPAPEFHQLPPQEVYNMMGHQHPPNVPAPESHQLSPQDMHNMMGHQHPHDIPAPEFHQLPPQEVYNMMSHQHPPNVPAPEFHQLPPQDVYNMMGHQNPPNVPAPEFHQLPPQDVHNMMGNQPPPNVPATESHQLPPQDEYNMMGNQHPHDIPAVEHHLSTLDYFNNTVKHEQVPALPTVHKKKEESADSINNVDMLEEPFLCEQVSSVGGLSHMCETRSVDRVLPSSYPEQRKRSRGESPSLTNKRRRPDSDNTKTQSTSSSFDTQSSDSSSDQEMVS
ncbi:uncharacterized protein [Hyperolius riggenbachi]|uniref:uncharacterized protein n=1 Tax=Hyperolius riggenbachi TaxID=752182 RepID=UPI0035A29F64